MTEPRTLYVARDGAIVRREGGRLRVFAGRELVHEVAARGLDQVVLMGSVTLTPPALSLLATEGIDAVLLSHHGNYRGRFVSGRSTNVRLRLAQYARLTDEQGILDRAKAIVEGKIRNQRTLVQRRARSRGDHEDLRRARIALRTCLRRAGEATHLDELRGCEGAASAAYFRAFPALLAATPFRFDGRNRRPPRDPVNALLSLGYTLLANAVEAAVHVVGLDPYLGALHSPESGRPSLVCDLQEELRAPLVDALVLSALHQGAFRPDDFVEREDECVELPRETVRWLVTLFERRLASRVLYAPRDQHYTWRGVIEQQARAFARSILRDEPYQPVLMR